MGIPGLLSEVQQVESFKRSLHYKGAYFYVDGLNIISSFAKMISEKSQQSPYVPYLKKMEKLLGKLQSYNPKQIEFYFDTYYPIDKSALKLQRRLKNLKELRTHNKVAYPDILAAKYLLSRGIKVVYTGLEAEDEIIKTISDRGKADPGSKHVVFSSDSDLFTFAVENAQNIEIVPLNQRKLGKSGLNSINLGEVRSKKLVRKKYMRPVPDHLEARSIKAVRPMSGVLSFINAKRAHGFSKRTLSLVYATQGVSPHDIGLDIRRGAYGLIFRKWFEGKTEPVNEEFQNGSKYASMQVTPLKGQQFEDFKRVMSTYSTGDIISNQFEVVAAKYDISNQEIAAVVTYINDLILKSKIKPQRIKPRAEVLFSLLKALLCAIMGWEEALGGVIQPDNLLWRIDVAELSSYI